MKKILLVIILFSLCFSNTNYYEGREAHKIWHDRLIARAEKRERENAIIGYILGVPLLGVLIVGIIHSLNNPRPERR